MFNPAGGLSRYHSVGRSGLRLILTALTARLGYQGYDELIGSRFRVLDFGCAYGRVTRFLTAAVPQADLAITDLNDEAVEWCVRNLGVRAVKGRLPEDEFDLVFLGSVFTHIPPGATETLLLELTKSRRPGGVLVFTTQGRYAHAEIVSRPDKPAYGLTQ